MKNCHCTKDMKSCHDKKDTKNCHVKKDMQNCHDKKDTKIVIVQNNSTLRNFVFWNPILLSFVAFCFSFSVSPDNPRTVTIIVHFYWSGCAPRRMYGEMALMFPSFMHNQNGGRLNYHLISSP